MIKQIKLLLSGSLVFASPLLGAVENPEWPNQLSKRALDTIQGYAGEETLSRVNKWFRGMILEATAVEYAQSIIKDEPVSVDVKKKLSHVTGDQEIEQLTKCIVGNIAMNIEGLLIKVRPMPPFLEGYFEAVTQEQIDGILLPLIEKGSVLRAAAHYLTHNVHLYRNKNTESDEDARKKIIAFAQTFMTLGDALTKQDASGTPMMIVSTRSELQNTQHVNAFFAQHPDKILVLDMEDEEGSRVYRNASGFIRKPTPFDPPPYSAAVIYEDDFPKVLGSIKNLVLVGRNITKIGSRAFYENTNLQSVQMPNTVESIGECAFVRCRALQTLVMPSSMKEIGHHAFSDCSTLKIVEMPKNVTSIGMGAFLNCTSLESVVIPSSVTEIFPDAFWACPTLKEIFVERGSYAERHMRRNYRDLTATPGVIKIVDR
ncbi:MAG: hypothetical protein HEEMFOPI_00378 [Holosporales bacterium]